MKRETFEQLVTRLTPDETWESFADRCGVTSRLLLYLRQGAGKRQPNRLTLRAIAAALEVDESVVLAAIQASRAAKADER